MFGGDKCPLNRYAKLYFPFALPAFTLSSLLNQAQQKSQKKPMQSNLHYGGQVNREILTL